jgi:hypothetical protein
MIELRLRSKVPAAELEQKVGKILTPKDFNVLLTGPTTVRKPDGRHLCVYLPGALTATVDNYYPILTKIRGTTDNRGLASGTERTITGPAQTRTRSMPVMSSILGAADPAGRFPYCRLTVFTAKEVDKWQGLHPLFVQIADLFEEHVPGRFAAQAEYARRTPSEWVIPGTPFTTITVNNSYSTGVHTDKGDLDPGFSTLAVLRRGNYSGGHIVFPEYRVAAEMKHGDLLLMDAHDFHGNTAMTCACGNVMREKPCSECGAERISVVSYYRTKMAQCGTMEEEDAKRLARLERQEATAS